MNELANLQPTTNSLPDSLRRLVTGESYWSDKRGEIIECAWSPAPVPAELRTKAQRALADLDHRLRPADRNWISGRIAALLAHYWMPDMPERMQEAVARDWTDVLGHLPREAIEAACRDYLARDRRTRPVPGEILALAETHIGGDLRNRDRLRACLDCQASKRGARPDYSYKIEMGLMTQEEADKLLARYD